MTIVICAAWLLVTIVCGGFFSGCIWIVLREYGSANPDKLKETNLFCGYTIGAYIFMTVSAFKNLLEAIWK